MNGIDSLLSSSASGALGNLGSIAGQTEDGTDSSFSDILGDIYNFAQDTDTADKGSTLSLLTGDVDDISSVMIDSQKAELALNLTIEVRNKVLDAYNEIMKMQV